MIYDPATDTTSIYYGHEHPPETPLQREWAALGTTILVVLLAPFWLAFKGCEKYQEWQEDRTYAFQEEVLKQPPLAVMVCKLGCLPNGLLHRGNVEAPCCLTATQSEDGDKKVDLMVLAPSKGEEDVQWLTCQIEAGSNSFKEYVTDGVQNFGGCTTVCCLFEGPDAWEQARPIGNLPEKPWQLVGRTHCLDHSVRDENFPTWFVYHLLVQLSWHTLCVPGRVQFRAFGGPSQPTSVPGGGAEGTMTTASLGMEQCETGDVQNRSTRPSLKCPDRSRTAPPSTD